MCEAVKTQWHLQGQDQCSLGRIMLLLSWKRTTWSQCHHWHAGAAGPPLWSRRKRFAVPGGGSSLGSGSMCRPAMLEVPVPRKISWPYFLPAFGGQDSPSGFLRPVSKGTTRDVCCAWRHCLPSAPTCCFRGLCPFAEQWPLHFSFPGAARPPTSPRAHSPCSQPGMSLGRLWICGWEGHPLGLLWHLLTGGAHSIWGFNPQ